MLVKHPIPSQYQAELEAERQKSRCRDSLSRERKHPISHDIHRAMDFVERRRKHCPGWFEAVKGVHYSVDTTALRTLVSLILEGGVYPRVEFNRCQRLLTYCNAIEAALAVAQSLSPTWGGSPDSEDPGPGRRGDKLVN